MRSFPTILIKMTEKCNGLYSLTKTLEEWEREGEGEGEESDGLMEGQIGWAFLTHKNVIRSYTGGGT